MNRFFLALSASLAILQSTACADTIYLKSGKVIEADILEDETDYIKVNFGGNPLYYQKKYIKQIEKGGADKDSSAGGTKGGKGFSSDDCFERGLEKAAGGDFSAAGEEFRKGILIKGDDSNLIAALNLLDDFEKGEIGREHVMDLSSGLLNMLRSDYGQAARYFDRALESDPDNVDIYYNLGVCYYSIGDYKQAISSFRKLLDIRPEDPEAYSLLGNAYYLTGQEQAARESFVLAKELFRKAQDPGSAKEIEVLLGRLFKN